MALAHVKHLPVQIDWEAATPAYAQLAGQINCLIYAKQLSDGDLLPQIRVLASQLDANPNTVVRAYDELEKLGVLRKRQGSGCFVTYPKVAARTVAERAVLLRDRIEDLVAAARTLGLSTGQLVETIRGAFPEPTASKPDQKAARETRQLPALDSHQTATLQSSPSLWQSADTLID